MAFDGFVTREVVYELKDKLINGRVYKIYQPNPTDLIFIIRGHGKTTNLLISANPTYPRIYVTTSNYVNPVEPPMFCMLLRKHLEGGIIQDMNQIDHERIIHIDLLVRDELGDLQTKRLIIEIMGRHSNIILVNPEQNIILDGINHVTAAISSYRQILPGKEYVSPPQQNKLNPLSVDKEQFLRQIQFNEGKIDKQIVDHFTGTSPSIAKEILFQAGLPTRENLWDAFSSMMNQVREHQYNPSITITDEKSDFSILPFSYLKGEINSYPTISECMEAYYEKKAERDTVRQKTLDLSKFLVNEKQKNEKKIEFLYNDLKAAEEAEKLKLYGELVTANMHLLQKGVKEAKVTNYYDEEQRQILIPLNPLKSPSENAQAYFKKYNKLKNSQMFIQEQLEKTKAEIVYLETILTQLENASVQDIEDVREELVEQGYLKAKKSKHKRKSDKPQIEQYLSSEGVTIYVGKNNKQNDYLTHRLANPFDTWFHTKDIPGSHVVIKGTDFGDVTLGEAANLAAYYSKAKHSSQVPVDYTLIKHVKKPSGAKPGFVIYENQKTLYVTPDEALIDQLKKKASL